jgi:protein-arginine kinase activator protein McsA
VTVANFYRKILKSHFGNSACHSPSLSPKVGDIVKPIKNSFVRIGRVILSGNSKESIEDKVKKIEELLKITTLLD